MTNYGKVTKISTQMLIMASIMLNIIIFSALSAMTFAQSNTLENRPPVIIVKSPIEGQINQTVIINASISDPDGNITSMIWNQESESPTVTMDISQNKQSMSFSPIQNTTYVFSIEGIDNNGLTTLESVRVNVGKQ